MLGFLTLVRAEWRNARALILISTGIGALGLWIVRQLLGPGQEGGWQENPGLYALWALFLQALASDLVAGDSGSGRLVTLASLPVGTARIWAAKVGFLLLAGIGFLAWLVAVELALALGLEGRTLAEVEQLLRMHLQHAPAVLAAVAGLTAATLFSSTLSIGGLASVALGTILFAAPIVAGCIWIAQEKAEVLWGSLLVAALLLAALLAAASLLAFVRGRVAGGARLRPALLGLGFLLLAGVPLAAYGRSAATRMVSTLPENPFTRIVTHRFWPSLDGRFVLLNVENRFATREGQWLLDLHTLELRSLDSRRWYFSGWSEDALLVAHDVGIMEEQGQGIPGRAEDVALLDPVTLQVSTRPGRLEERQWWIREPHAIHYPERGLSLKTAEGERAYPQRRSPGRVVLRRGDSSRYCDHWMVDMVSGERWQLASDARAIESPNDILDLSNRYALFSDIGGHSFVVDGATGERVRELDGAERAWWVCVPPSRSILRCELADGTEQLVDPEQNRSIALVGWFPNILRGTRLHARPEGGFIGIGTEWIAVLDGSGRFVRYLFFNPFTGRAGNLPGAGWRIW